MLLISAVKVGGYFEEMMENGVFWKRRTKWTSDGRMRMNRI